MGALLSLPLLAVPSLGTVRIYSVTGIIDVNLISSL